MVNVESKTEQWKQRHTAALQRTMPVLAETYLAFIRDRFVREGDGDWMPLAPRTVRERTEQGFGPTNPILRRLEILYQALYPGANGNLFEQDGNQMTVGIAGGGAHPGYGVKFPNDNELSIGAIAAIHQFGLGNIPQRTIFVAPDDATSQRMQAELIDGLVAEFT